MGWLSEYWTREGEGIPADAPKSRGLRLFGEIIWRELWDLFVLHLGLVLFSLPVFTAPAAHAAATRVASIMTRDENLWLFRDFWTAFRDLFLRASLAGLLAGAPILLGLYAVWIWGQMAAREPLFFAPLLLSLLVTIFLAIWAAQLFVLIANSEAPLPALMRSALAASFVRPLPMLAALGFVAALWLAHVAFYPASVFMPAVCNFSLSVLALTFAGLPGARPASPEAGAEP